MNSPFRYPGSKNKILPILNKYFDEIMINQNHFIDLFVGGGSIILDIAERYPNAQLYANDKDYWIYCFWNIISANDTYKLYQLLDLIKAQPTLELFYKLRNTKTTDEVECAYRAVFFNRTTFSGIAHAGPIGGKEQKSKYTVNCRYNYDKLRNKILKCHELLVGRTIVSNSDFSECKVFLETNYPVYLDPPYFRAGKSLYPVYMTETQHQQLRDILLGRNNWILSYDDCTQIRELYKNNKVIDLSARYCINGKKENWESKNEVIILP